MVLFQLVSGAVANRGVAISTLAITIAAVFIAVGSWHLGSDVIPSVLDAEKRLSKFRELSLGELVADEPSARDDLLGEVTEVRADLGSSLRLARWVGRFAPALSWLPLANREMNGWASQGERVRKDLDAASTMLQSSSQLLDVYSDAQSPILSTRSGSAIPLLKVRVRELRDRFQGSLGTVTDARRNGQSFVVGLQFPRVRGLTGALGELEDRMLTASEVGREVSTLLDGLLELADGAQPLIGQFVINGSDPEPWTSETLKSALVSVEERTISARNQASEVARLISGSGQADWLLPELAALDQVLGVLASVADAGMVGLDVVEPVAKAIERSNGGLLEGGRDLIDMLDAAVDNGDAIAGAISGLEEAQRTLEGLVSEGDAKRFVGGLSDLSKLVSELHSGLTLAHSFAPVGRDLFGAGGARRYLVLGQSVDELRGTGGFVSGVWLITFEDGALANVKYQDSVRVDDWERLMLYPNAPPGLEEHMNAWVWLLRDVSWDPDFPTTARSAEDMYRLGQRQEVDGVIAINQWTLLRLIEALGSIPSPDGSVPISSRNLLPVLEQGTDRHGRAYLDVVLQGVLDRLNRPTQLPELMRLASAMLDTLESRDMLIFFDHADPQFIVSQFGWDGRVRQDSLDYLYVVDSNLGWSKVDRNIERDISYYIDLSRGPQPRAYLTLGYANHSGPGASGCVPQWLLRDTNYDQQKNACYWNFMRVYIPQGSRILTSTPLPLPEYSVSVEIGRGVPGQKTGSISSSHNRLVFSGFAPLEAGKRKEITLAYDLPSDVVRREGDTLTYELLLQKQPGVRERNVSIELVQPEGYHLSSSSVAPRETSDSRLKFSILLTRDAILTVEFTRDVDGPP